jgi:hypothetical protein
MAFCEGLDWRIRHLMRTSCSAMKSRSTCGKCKQNVPVWGSVDPYANANFTQLNKTESLLYSRLLSTGKFGSYPSTKIHRITSRYIVIWCSLPSLTSSELFRRQKCKSSLRRRIFRHRYGVPGHAEAVATVPAEGGAFLVISSSNNMGHHSISIETWKRFLMNIFADVEQEMGGQFLDLSPLGQKCRGAWQS